MAALEPVCDLVWKVLLSPLDRPDGRKQFAPQHIFVKVTLCAEAQSLVNAIVIVQRGDDNERRPWKFRAQDGDDILPGNDWQIPVQERDIRPQIPEPLNGLNAVLGFPCDDHVRLSVHNCADSLSHGGVVINDEHANFCWV